MTGKLYELDVVRYENFNNGDEKTIEAAIAVAMDNYDARLQQKGLIPVGRPVLFPQLNLFDSTKIDIIVRCAVKPERKAKKRTKKK